MYVAAKNWSGQFLPWGAGGQFVNPPVVIGGRRVSLGMGAASDCEFPYLASGCVKAAWSWMFPPKDPVVAPPRIPSGAHGEQVFPVPGSSGGVTLPTSGSPDDVVSEIVDQQLIDQQVLNAGKVQGSVLWDIEGAAARAGDAAVKSVTSPLLWLAVGIGVFGFVAISAGGPRRYGR